MLSAQTQLERLTTMSVAHAAALRASFEEQRETEVQRRQGMQVRSFCTSKARKASSKAPWRLCTSARLRSTSEAPGNAGAHVLLDIFLLLFLLHLLRCGRALRSSARPRSRGVRECRCAFFVPVKQVKQRKADVQRRQGVQVRSFSYHY